MDLSITRLLYLVEQEVISWLFKSKFGEEFLNCVVSLLVELWSRINVPLELILIVVKCQKQNSREVLNLEMLNEIFR